MARTKLKRFKENSESENIIEVGKPSYETIKGNWHTKQFQNNNPINFTYMLHTLLSFFVNLIIYAAVLGMWLGANFLIFGIKPKDYILWQWLKVFAVKILKPFLNLAWKFLQNISLALCGFTLPPYKIDKSSAT